jgi:pimeloyl-ACP methyl ester carboxylesterase
VTVEKDSVIPIAQGDQFRASGVDSDGLSDQLLLVAAAALLLRSYTPSLSEPLSLQLASRGTQQSEGGLRWRWDPLLRDLLYGVAFSGTQEQYLSLLQRIAAPVTLMTGASSRFHSKEHALKLRSALPHARSLTLPGGHNIHLDATDALFRCIAEAAGARAGDAVLAPSA